MTQNHELRPVREIADGSTEKTPRLNATFSIGDEATNAIIVTVQIYEYEDTLAETKLVRAWLSDTAAGAVSAVTTGAVSTGTELEEITANGEWAVITNSSGVLAITGTIAGAATRYLNVAIGSDIFSSSVITWAA